MSRPVEVDSDQIETLIENNQYSTMREIADSLKISKSIKLLVKMKNVYFKEKSKCTFWPTQQIGIPSSKLEEEPTVANKISCKQTESLSTSLLLL